MHTRQVLYLQSKLGLFLFWLFIEYGSLQYFEIIDNSLNSSSALFLL
jgi:hypothetical protein